MIKLYRLLIVTVAIMSPFSAFAGVKENKFCAAGGASLSFTLNSPDSFIITDNAQFAIGIPQNGCIVILANRKKSKSVAKWIKKYNETPINAYTIYATLYKASSVDRYGVCISDESCTPSTANFAVKGTLYITKSGKISTCTNVIIAQSSLGTYNIWWVANNKNGLGEYEISCDNATYSLGPWGNHTMKFDKI